MLENGFAGTVSGVVACFLAAAEEAEAQRSMLSGMFSFMKKTKRIRHNPESEGIYLSDLNADELDPEVAALYFPTSYRQGGHVSPGTAGIVLLNLTVSVFPLTDVFKNLQLNISRRIIR